MPTTVHGIEEIKAQAGADLGHTAWREIDQPRVDLFADATDDHQWIHTDAERAKTGPFGGTIAHGYLTLSLLIPLWSELLAVEGVAMAVNYGLNKVRFPAPVPVGAKIRAHGTIVSVEDVKGGGVEVVVDLTVEIDGIAKPACVAQAVYRFYA
ncbi:enoyl-CoA hydratase [Streptomyces sp. CB02959]|uniref:MaoC family dehydratase n=1 Tax=Streptomyces sp. CB02959 TaxID=2020330 RepID=UPI000C272412|nr:MaoC family dehydratase [Streptomyces sp. CB02959]PJN42019.1 enoyl-CoA hydratase [Streptomyces sp. CB02959]